MAANSGIEWTTHTFNPWRGCTKVSDGCKFCYADTLSQRNPATLGVWGPKGSRVIAAESYWREPLKWNKAAQVAGERHRVFCASLADVFEGNETMPRESRAFVWEARLRLFQLIMETPHLDWLLLTKRPENVYPALCLMMNQAYGVPVEESPFAGWLERWVTEMEIPHNVWIGTSVENQETADERIPHLLKIPAKVRFLSCEPLLGEVDISEYLQWSQPDDNEGDPNFVSRPPVQWVITGGESGPQARPSHPAWFRQLRDQCLVASVPFFFKQWGEHAPIYQIPGGVKHTNPEKWDGIWLKPDGTTATGMHQNDGRETLFRVGKKQAGHLLDGMEWHQFPEVRHAGD